eukprot:5451064-Karenia_brevis.AAC.1
MPSLRYEDFPHDTGMSLGTRSKITFAHAKLGHPPALSRILQWGSTRFHMRLGNPPAFYKILQRGLCAST